MPRLTKRLVGAAPGGSFGQREVQRAINAIRAAEDSEGGDRITVELDLTSLSPRGTSTAPLFRLSKAIAVADPQVHLHAKLPSATSAVDALLRTGVLAALKCRPAQTTQIDLSGVGEQLSALDRGMESIFTLKNLHLQDMQVTRQIVASRAETLVRPYLESQGASLTPQQLSRIGDGLRRVAVEVAENIVHAFPPWHGEGVRRSFLSLFITRGGGRESHNRLYVLAFDTGIGMEVSLDRKVSRRDSRYKYLTGQHVFSGGRLPDGGGLGYREIANVLRMTGGRLQILTGLPGGGLGQIALEVKPPWRRSVWEETQSESEPSEAAFRGTSVLVSVFVPTAIWLQEPPLNQPEPETIGTLG